MRGTEQSPLSPTVIAHHLARHVLAHQPLRCLVLAVESGRMVVSLQSTWHRVLGHDRLEQTVPYRRDVGPKPLAGAHCAAAAAAAPSGVIVIVAGSEGGPAVLARARAEFVNLLLYARRS